LKSVTYNIVTVIWIAYLRREPKFVPRMQPMSTPNVLGMALAASEHVVDSEAGFMSRVEAAVERVLSRSDWPRTAVQGSRIVGRKPRPEEQN
jgi:hypothetical protein